jgi:hypothetical protein
MSGSGSSPSPHARGSACGPVRTASSSGALVFIIALVFIESLLLAPGILRRRRLRKLGYEKVYTMNGEEFEEYLQALFQGKGYRVELTPTGAHYKADRGLLVTVASFTQQAIKLAWSCSMDTWDGERLQKEVLALNAAQPFAQAHTFAPSKLAVPAHEPPTCSECGRVKVRRSSQYGQFWGCSGFPACRGTLPA